MRTLTWEQGNILNLQERQRLEHVYANHQKTSDVKLKVLLTDENTELFLVSEDKLKWFNLGVYRICNIFAVLHLCPFYYFLIKRTNHSGWRARHCMFISVEVEVSAFIWSVRVLFFRLCRDGHTASDRVLYIHPEPFIHVYVHACFWQRTENFEHLPCGLSRVREPQWRGQMDWVLLLNTIHTDSERNKETERQSTRQRDFIIEMENKNTPWKRNLGASKLRR